MQSALMWEGNLCRCADWSSKPFPLIPFSSNWYHGAQILGHLVMLGPCLVTSHTAWSYPVGWQWGWHFGFCSVLQNLKTPVKPACGRESVPVCWLVFKTSEGRKTVLVGSTPTLFRQHLRNILFLKIFNYTLNTGLPYEWETGFPNRKRNRVDNFQ